MRRRCYDPNHRSYKDYGALGVRVYFGWLPGPGPGGFAQFLEDVGERPEGHTLGRINHEGHYGPDNVRWEPAPEQNAERNARVLGQGTDLVEVDGERRTKADWAAYLGISYRTLSRRLQRGWGLDAYRVPAGARRPR